VTRAGASGGAVIDATVKRTGADGLAASFLPGSIGERYAPIHWQVVSAVYGRPSCRARPLGAVGCGVLYPARPALTALQRPAPTGCTAAGPAYVTGSTLPDPGKAVALTFDDGPWSDTPQFLDVLEREHAVATFFQIGRQLSSYGAVDDRMLADGDVIGDHTWDHAGVAGAGAFAQSEIERDAAAIKARTGFTPCLFRAPYGATSPALIALARRLGFTTVQWDVDPSDWRMPGTAAIEQRVIGAVRPGSIVIQHDGGGNRTQTLAALPHEIEKLRADGYRFVTVPQLLGLRMTY
jgi:peptidoglycan/xylan/chitin deacetylase (PgdA/CDA1 family)